MDHIKNKSNYTYHNSHNFTGKEKHQLVIVLPEEAKKDYGTQIENIKSQLGDYSLDGIIIEYKEKGKN